jgi:hypothetical protein
MNRAFSAGRHLAALTAMNTAPRVLALLVLGALLASSSPSRAEVSVGVSLRVRSGPPPLPAYDQPPAPAPGYVWVPGAWAWDEQGGYYWVPGTWVVAPVGMLWTPGWWGWSRGFYVWHHGYWGPRVGFYGGIHYGHGYPGTGYVGGSWRGNVFYSNRTDQPVAVRRASTASFNGGPGGVVARASAEEEAASRAPHLAPLPIQAQHQQQAARDPRLYSRANRGVPPVAATARPTALSGQGVVASRAPAPAFKGNAGPRGTHKHGVRAMHGARHHGGGHHRH